jgi:hypothetical protein
MLEKRELKTFTNLEKVFIVVDYEAFRNKCSYRHRGTSNDYCGTFGLTENDIPVKCTCDACPFVYAIVTEAKEIEAKSGKPLYCT